MKTILGIATLSLVIACSGTSGGSGTMGSSDDGTAEDGSAKESPPSASPKPNDEPRSCGDNGLYNAKRTAACRACLERTCCDQLSACAKDEQCTAYMHCWDDLRCTRYEDPGCNQCVRAVMDAPEGYVGKPVNRLWDCKDKCWAQCT